MCILSVFVFFVISILGIQFKDLNPKDKMNLRKKAISYLSIALMQIFAIKFDFYFVLAILIVGFCFYEFYRLKLSSWLYVPLGVFSVLFVYFSKMNINLMETFCLVILFDGYSELFGKTVGLSKIAPKISPNKTWEGFLMALMLIVFHATIFNLENPLAGISNGLLIGLLAFFGDLLASYLKRAYQLKDFSNLIPNHGGFLDRFDSLIFTFSMLSIFSFFENLTYFEVFKNYTLCFLLIFMLAEFIYHGLNQAVEISRKFVHIVSGLITLTFPKFIDNLSVVILLCLGFMLVLFLSKKWKLLKSIHDIDRKSFGSIYYPISVIICFVSYLFFKDIMYFFVPILILTISDSMAALVGKTFPKYKLLNSEKTVFGTLAFFLSSLVILWFGLNQSLFSVVIIAIFLTITEFFSKKGIDNLLIVLVAILGIFSGF